MGGSRCWRTCWRTPKMIQCEESVQRTSVAQQSRRTHRLIFAHDDSCRRRRACVLSAMDKGGLGAGSDSEDSACKCQKKTSGRVCCRCSCFVRACIALFDINAISINCVEVPDGDRQGRRAAGLPQQLPYIRRELRPISPQAL